MFVEAISFVLFLGSFNEMDSEFKLLFVSSPRTCSKCLKEAWRRHSSSYLASA